MNNPNDKYVVTGYWKKINMMNTRICRGIDDVFGLIMSLSPEATAKKYKVAGDLDFDIQSRRSHEGAVIINDDNYCWSLFYMR